MKKLTSLIILITIIITGTLYSYSSDDSNTPEYIRVGISDVDIGQYDLSTAETNGLAVYEYISGSVNQISNLSNQKSIIISVENNQISLKSTAGNQLFSYTIDKNYFIGSNTIQSENVVFEGNSYRGGIMLKSASTGTLKIINVLRIEHYIYGVLPKEMSSSSPEEALKAQAVAARSFTVSNMDNHVSEGYDICSSSHCQVYGGISCETQKTNEAADATAGQLAYFGTEPISGYYHKNSGGYIDSSENVWGTAIGYLKEKKDEYSPDYLWTYELSYEKIQTILQGKGYDPGVVSGVKINKAADSGSVIELTFTGNKNTVTLKRETIRTVFGYSNLKSLKFTVLDVLNQSTQNQTVFSDKIYMRNSDKVQSGSLKNSYAIGADGEKIKLTQDYLYVVSADKVSMLKPSTNTGTFNGIAFSGRGYGHGLGMSQDGAVVMANEGFKYDEILKYYYTGIDIH